MLGTRNEDRACKLGSSQSLPTIHQIHFSYLSWCNCYNSSLVSQLEKAAIVCVLLCRMFRFKKRQPNATLETKAYCACQICIWSSVMGGPGYVCPKMLHQVNFNLRQKHFKRKISFKLLLVTHQSSWILTRLKWFCNWLWVEEIKWKHNGDRRYIKKRRLV